MNLSLFLCRNLTVIVFRKKLYLDTVNSLQDGHLREEFAAHWLSLEIRRSGVLPIMVYMNRGSAQTGYLFRILIQASRT